MTYNVEVIDNQVVLKFGYNGALPQTFVLTPDEAKKLHLQIMGKLRTIGGKTVSTVLFKQVEVGQNFRLPRGKARTLLTRIEDVYDTDRMIHGKKLRVKYNAADAYGRLLVNPLRKVVIVE